MPTTSELQERPFTRGQKVRLVDDIPSHAAGSRGKVAVANGLTWLRYWIRFSDGSTVGHVDHGSLVRSKDFDTFLAAREREAVEAELAAEAALIRAETEEPDDDGGGGGGTAAGSVEVNGVAIPQRLLDMSSAARARLGA